MLEEPVHPARNVVWWNLLDFRLPVPEQNIVSFQSPLAQGLISKELDDDVTIPIPAGTRRLRILDIQRFDDD